MAVYTHFKNYPANEWADVIGDVYTAIAPVLVEFDNSDGTTTQAEGNFGLLGDGTIFAGEINKLTRVAMDGTVYESITGLKLDAKAFADAIAVQKLALALAGNDTLNGNGGEDFLKGYGGADVLIGGDDDDQYSVDDPSDVVLEGNDQGTDEVFTTLASYTLPENVEDLSFSAAIFHTGIGNMLGNEFFGSTAHDTFFGLDGNDRFHSLGGSDHCHGGKGQDIYYLKAGDSAIELPDEGFDQIAGQFDSYALPANVEGLADTGNGTGVIIGNELDNLITVYSQPGRTVLGLAGNDRLVNMTGNNTLNGGEGDDRLTATTGSATLIGGAGDDTFVVRFAKAVITDFAAGDGTPDRIDLTDNKPGASPDKGQHHFTTLSDILAHTTQNGADAVIDLGAGNTLTLKNVQASALTAGDFINIGGPGDQTFVYNFPKDAYDGDAGNDTAVFQEALGTYQVLDLGEKIVVSTPYQSFKVRNVEHLQFKDGTVHVNDGDALFDTLAYMASNPDVFHAGVDALAHYTAHGWHEGRDPNPFFDTSGYLAVNKDVAASGANPLEDYRAFGWKEGRDPSADFDVTLYLARNPDVAAAGVDPLAHWLQHGRAEGRVAYQAVGSAIVNGFDAQYYLLHNPDVAAAGVDPLAHFNAHGWHEGRNPNGWFDAAGYLAHHFDVAAAGANPLDHYMQSGWQEGRDASTRFDTQGYLAANPDVAAAGVNPLEHFLKFGIYEGRQAIDDGVWL